MEQKIITTHKGTNFLKVTGILMIIGGSLGIIITLIGAAAIAALISGAGALLGQDFMSEANINGTLLWAGFALSLVGAVMELVAGILGVANCRKPEKANTCLAFGIVVAVLSVAGQIFNAAGGGTFSVFSLILGLVLPVLYIIGAAFNKQAHSEMSAAPEEASAPIEQ